MRIVWSSRLLAICFAVVAAVGAMITWSMGEASRSSSYDLSLSDPESTQRIGMVRLKPTRDTCREFDLDNATNKLRDRGILRCDPNADETSSPRLRLDAIRDSFRNRP